MLKGEAPRQYYFHQGDFYCHVNFEAVASGVLTHDKQVLARGEALKLLHIRAASYKRPFNIETYTIEGIHGLVANVLLASRGNNACGLPYRYVSRGRLGEGKQKEFATAAELLLYFEDLMMRFFLGEEDVL